MHWVEPERRGVFPLDGLKVSRAWPRRCAPMRSKSPPTAISREVMQACAARDKTWINAEILRLYCELHDAARRIPSRSAADGELVGGLYGVSLGAAFFGESMFHTVRDASKVALVHLVARLRLGGYKLLDTQFLTPHLASLGAVEIGRAEYRRRLSAALRSVGEFATYPPRLRDARRASAST